MKRKGKAAVCVFATMAVLLGGCGGNGSEAPAAEVSSEAVEVQETVNAKPVKDIYEEIKINPFYASLKRIPYFEKTDAILC